MTTLTPGQRVREVLPVASPERGWRGGELREIRHYLGRVYWDWERPDRAVVSWIPLDQLAPEVVHVLHHGLPLCGFSRDVPRDWPAGHVWTYASDVEHVSCAGCQQRAAPDARQP